MCSDLMSFAALANFDGREFSDLSLGHAQLDAAMLCCKAGGNHIPKRRRAGDQCQRAIAERRLRANGGLNGKVRDVNSSERHDDRCTKKYWDKFAFNSANLVLRAKAAG